MAARNGAGSNHRGIGGGAQKVAQSQGAPSSRTQHETSIAESADQRRQRPIKIEWVGDHIGRLSVEGIAWGAVEWSHKRQAWCIEDAEGKCLRRASSIHGEAAAKDEAVGLAKAMIRDGRMPSPEQAKQLHKQRLERQRNRPSAIRQRKEREQQREQGRALLRTMSRAERRDQWDKDVSLLWELFADAYDLTDPDLWRSNSFALLRPRLIISVEAAVARQQYEIFEAKRRGRKHRLPAAEQRLARAQSILRLLKGGDDTAAGDTR